MANINEYVRRREAMLSATILSPECGHAHTHVERSNSGDGSATYDFWTEFCDDCGEELGEPS